MSESNPASSSFSGRLIDLARENPDQIRWLGAVVGIFLLIYFLPPARRASTTPCWRASG